MNRQAKNDTSHRDIALDILVPLGCDFGLFGLFCQMFLVSQRYVQAYLSYN